MKIKLCPACSKRWSDSIKQAQSVAKAKGVVLGRPRKNKGSPLENAIHPLQDETKGQMTASSDASQPADAPEVD